MNIALKVPFRVETEPTVAGPNGLQQEQGLNAGMMGHGVGHPSFDPACTQTCPAGQVQESHNGPLHFPLQCAGTRCVRAAGMVMRTAVWTKTTKGAHVSWACAGDP